MSVPKNFDNRWTDIALLNSTGASYRSGEFKQILGQGACILQREIVPRKKLWATIKKKIRVRLLCWVDQQPQPLKTISYSLCF